MKRVVVRKKVGVFFSATAQNERAPTTQCKFLSTRRFTEFQVFKSLRFVLQESFGEYSAKRKTLSRARVQ